MVEWYRSTVGEGLKYILYFSTKIQGRTWLRNFRVHRVRQNSYILYLKQAKLGTLEYSGVNQAITVWIWKNNTIRLPRKRKKDGKIYVLLIPFTNDHIFFRYEYILLSGQKNISVQWRQCSAILFRNTSHDCSVHTTSEDRVLRRTPAHMFQRTWFLFCLFGVEGGKRTGC